MERGNYDGKRQAAIVALLSEPTLEGAARRVGVDPATLHRWLRDDDFSAEYRRARREALSLAVAQLQGGSSKAGKALLEIIEDRRAPATARVRAIEALFEISLRAIELDDLAARIERLERLAKGETDEWQGVNTSYEYREPEETGTGD